MAEILLDRVSRELLGALQHDARQSLQQLAERVGVSTTPVWRRIRDMEASGVIRRHVALADREKLGLSICVLAHISLIRHSEGAVEEFERMVRASPAIIECHATTGEADYIIKVVATDMKAYDAFLQAHIARLAGVSSVRSSVVLREVKYETALPVGG